MSLKSDEEHCDFFDRLIDGQVMYVSWDTGGPGGGGFTYVSQMGKRKFYVNQDGEIYGPFRSVGLAGGNRGRRRKALAEHRNQQHFIEPA